jgi:PAS domain S-box-containing protein
MQTKTGRLFLLSGSVLVTLVVWIVDLLTPRGIEVWVFYLPIILSMILSKRTKLILIAATASSVLVILGYYISPLGYNPLWWDVVNRVMGLLAIWLSALSGTIICFRSGQLTSAIEELNREIESRKQTEQLLRESEERMRLAMESGDFGTRDVNLKVNREIWSETHFRICGYEPVAGGAAVGGMLDSLIHKDDFKRIFEARQQARKQRSLYHVEYRLRRADTQKIVWIEVWGRYYYDEGGEAVRFVGICFDISRRKELERKELEREILEITTTQQQIIGQDLHDGLGQELTGLGLMAQTLAQLLAEDSMGKRISTRLIAGIDHTHRMVRDLSRGLVAIEVDPSGLAAALNELANWTTENAGISVIVECSDSLEMPSQTTATHVFRIVQEAVSNALRHGQPRLIHLTVLSESSGLRVDIKDDGVGLPVKAEVKHGLGLRIMKYRAGLIGGVLQIESPEEGGTRVNLTIPKGNNDEYNSTEN